MLFFSYGNEKSSTWDFLCFVTLYAFSSRRLSNPFLVIIFQSAYRMFFTWPSFGRLLQLCHLYFQRIHSHHPMWIRFCYSLRNCKRVNLRYDWNFYRFLCLVNLNFLSYQWFLIPLLPSDYPISSSYVFYCRPNVALFVING